MTFLNQFHKEAVERKLRKIDESMKSPMNSVDAANDMKHNIELTKNLQAVFATPIEIDTYMAAIGYTKQNNEGRYAYADYVV